MKINEAQAIIREASPDFLANHPPIGVKEVLADITRRLTQVEFRKPFVRIPDECDEKLVCNMCLGDGDVWICEQQEVTDCPYCGGNGYLSFNYNQVFIMIYRDFRSVEALVEVATNGDCSATVTVSEPGFKAGEKIELTEEEKDLARGAIKEAK